MAKGKLPVPFRTRKSSSPAPMVLRGGPRGRVGRRRTYFRWGRSRSGGGPNVLCCHDARAEIVAGGTVVSDRSGFIDMAAVRQAWRKSVGGGRRGAGKGGPGRPGRWSGASGGAPAPRSP